MKKKTETSLPWVPSDSDPDWQTESDEGSEVDYNDLPTIIPLLPVPPNLVLPKDKLCKVCKGLGLSAEQFVVDRSESEACNSTLIKKELVTDMLKKSYYPLCRLIITALGGSKLPTVEDGASVWVTLESYTNDGTISSPDGDDLLQIRGLYPYAYKLKGKSLSARGQLPTLPEITLLANDSPVLSARLVRPIQQDKIDFNLVRNWIQICEVDHRKDCDKGMMGEHQQDHPADVIPDFRLIDVVDNCLVRGADIHGVKYATLSYVWGRVEFLRTLKSNVGHFEQHGGLWRPEVYEKIPLTIRDAMQVTKEIGLRYLWVDSLCIVQDDDSGKKEEAIKRMDLVYGASFITILAGTGNDANAGLPGMQPGTRNFRQSIEQIGPGFRLGFKPTLQDDMKSSTYYKRCWTFQENLFSQRKLTFIGGQVVFDCQRMHELREDVVSEDVEVTQTQVRREANDIGTFEGLFQSYSGLKLSFDTDIYFAFAGVSRQTAPTPRKLLDPPEYCEDILNPRPGSGILQFWTVSVVFNLKSSSDVDTDTYAMTLSEGQSRLGIFGKSRRRLGHVVVGEDWKQAHVPGEHEFVLLCEGRDKRAKSGAEDKEKGWKYMVMLIEPHGDWYERVAIGSIEKDLFEALAEGALWKEIVLG
ncbi:hypothetical protein ONZ45_g3729 [Pleurotus djamor]|nr:hypothetical protein ONZ45_g3729 [Pleurotus djamor]